MLKTIKLVIAEDDPQIAEIQRRYIERIEGFELVGIAHSLADAEDLVDVLKPELILLDIQFPSGTGLDLLRSLRANNSATDVILITAAREVDTLKEALRGGVFDYILKPLVFERLQEALSHFAEHLNKLHTMQSLAQNDVDTLLPRGASNKNTPAFLPDRLPKGIDALTLEKVSDALKSSARPLNAEEVGAMIGASRTTARRYLEHLVSTHIITAQVEYGSVGRPERRYTKTK